MRQALAKAFLKMDARIASFISKKTAGFINGVFGRFFLSVILVGPISFLPTVWEAWTAPNIDALRTLTWPSMLIVNAISLVSLSHNGDWRMRTAIMVWMMLVALVWIATIIR